MFKVETLSSLVYYSFEMCQIHVGEDCMKIYICICSEYIASEIFFPRIIDFNLIKRDLSIYLILISYASLSLRPKIFIVYLSPKMPLLFYIVSSVEQIKVRIIQNYPHLVLVKKHI